MKRKWTVPVSGDVEVYADTAEDALAAARLAIDFAESTEEGCMELFPGQPRPTDVAGRQADALEQHLDDGTVGLC